MPSLFDTNERAEMIRRVESISEDRAPQWGKMNAAQMLGHCVKPIAIATGDLEMKRTLGGRIMGLLFKKLVLSPSPFKRDLPTDQRFLVTGQADLLAEKKGLIELIEKFAAQGPEVMSVRLHPAFGKMTAEQWDHLMCKHLDHHLRQFEA